jgi:hypothetical protein
MKLFIYFLLIKSIELKKYVLIRDEEMDKNGLSQFSILDSYEKDYLYRLKTSSNNDLILISYPSKEIVGHLQGDWINEKTLNVTFEIFDLKTNEWTNVSFIKIFHLFIEKYLIQWNNQTFLMKKNLFSINHSFYDQNKTKLGQFRMRFRWFNWSLIKYDLKINFDTLPHFIYFFLLIIQDHRNIIL